MSLEFKISRDSTVLDQYYQLREQCFRSDLGLTKFDGSEEEQDKHSHIMVALKGGRCVGGVRISSHVTLTSHLDLMGLEKDACCMWERFAIDPAMRSLTLFSEFSQQLVERTRDIGYQSAMVLSSLPNARFYRRCHTALGVKFKIHRHVPHLAEGAFSGLEHYLSVAYLGQSDSLRVAV